MIVLVIALLVFGPKRLPELGRQIGRGIRDLKSQVNSITDDVRSSVDRDDDRDRATPGAPQSPAATAPTPVAAAAPADDDDLLDGVVVSGADGPPPAPPAES